MDLLRAEFKWRHSVCKFEILRYVLKKQGYLIRARNSKLNGWRFLVGAKVFMYGGPHQLKVK